MEPDATTITAKDLNTALRKAKGNSKELIESEVDYDHKIIAARQTRNNALG